MQTNTSINPNYAARLRWQDYSLIQQISVKPVREATAEIVGALERAVALPGARPPTATCLVDIDCLPRNGITIEYFLLLLKRTLARILQISSGLLQQLPCTKAGYLLLEYTL